MSVVVLATLLAPSCRGCNAAGCFDLLTVTSRPTRPGTFIDVCLDETCLSADPLGGTRQVRLVPAPQGPEAVVLVRIRMHGESISENSYNVPVERYYPNGRNCKPSCSRLHVLLDQQGLVAGTLGTAGQG